MLFLLLNILYFYISTFCIMCAVPKMAVLFVVPQFRAFSVYSVRHFLNNLEMVPVAYIITAITFVFTLLVRFCKVFIL